MYSLYIMHLKIYYITIALIFYDIVKSISSSYICMNPDLSVIVKEISDITILERNLLEIY